MTGRPGALAAGVAYVAWLWVFLDSNLALFLKALEFGSWGLWFATALILTGPAWMLWAYVRLDEPAPGKSVGRDESAALADD